MRVLCYLTFSQIRPQNDWEVSCIFLFSFSLGILISLFGCEFNSFSFSFENLRRVFFFFFFSFIHSFIPVCVSCQCCIAFGRSRYTLKRESEHLQLVIYILTMLITLLFPSSMMMSWTLRGVLFSRQSPFLRDDDSCCISTFVATWLTTYRMQNSFEMDRESRDAFFARKQTTFFGRIFSCSHHCLVSVETTWKKWLKKSDKRV